MSSMSTAQPLLYPPLPQADQLTQFFWDGVAAGRLMILRCDSCGFYIHLPKIVCRRCLSASLTPTEVSGRGVLTTWTVPLQPFDPYYQAHLPYVLAVVELEEQANLKMVTNMVDCEEADLRIEMPVAVTFREIVPGLTLPLFAPSV